MNIMNKQAILCVDDEVTILRSLAMELEEAFEEKYIYEFAESASEALEILEELHQDGVKTLIIVSDWLMPGIKGDDFLIDVHQKYPNIIKIMLTGQIEADAIKRVQKEANLYKFLSKPWQNHELIEIIKSALNSNR